MNVMRFTGKTSREAMRKLREALGPDALVLANRPCAEGIELLAAAPGALDAAMPAPMPAPARRAAPAAAPSAAQRAASRASLRHDDADDADDAAPTASGVPPGMSTVSFQDYVRQRLRERNRAQSGDGAPALGERIAPTAALAAGALAATAPRAAAVAPRAAPPIEPPWTPPRQDVAPIATPHRAAALPPIEAPRPQAARRAPPVPSRAAPADFDPPAAPEARPAAPRTDAFASPIRAEAFARPDAEPAPFGDFRFPDTQPAPAASDRLAPASFVPRAPTGLPGTDRNEALVAELQSLKSMISRQFATISWFEGVRRSPVQGKLLRTMVAAGMSLKLARSVVSKLPSDYGDRDAQTWLEEVLARNLRCARPAEAFDAGGTFALIGPTGVGKTTTTAKIAAAHVLKHGAQSVALITVDTYRMGAHDQLRAFGRILGVPVHIAHDASALHDLLRLRASRQLVLIDTVGMGHRDERIRSLLMSLPRGDIQHVVVASCAAQAETIDESLRAYEARQAAGVVLTKVDEAARLGGAIDCLLRQRLRLLGVCDGQRVPEDWHAADASKLVRRAMLASRQGAFALDDEELPLVFGVAATLQGSRAHA